MKIYSQCHLRWRFAQVFLWQKSSEEQAADSLLRGCWTGAYDLDGDSLEQGYRVAGREVFILPLPATQAKPISDVTSYAEKNALKMEFLEREPLEALVHGGLVMDVQALLSTLEDAWLYGVERLESGENKLDEVTILVAPAAKFAGESVSESLLKAQSACAAVQAGSVQVYYTEDKMVWRFACPALKAHLLGNALPSVDTDADTQIVEMYFERRALVRSLNALRRQLLDIHEKHRVLCLEPHGNNPMEQWQGEVSSVSQWSLFCEERRNIAWVYFRLKRFVERLRRGLALPSELTVIVSRGYAEKSMAWFMAMARRAVIEKYRKKECWDALGCLENAKLPNAKVAASADDLLGDCKRISIHSSHCYCEDVDVFLCLNNPRRLSDWVFLMPDLRFRTHAQSFERLEFMCDCWAHYLQCGYREDARGFGFDNIPLTDDYASPEPKRE